MPYAIKEDGAYRAISIDMELGPGETSYEEIPQWVYDRIEAERLLAEQISAENAWRVDEVAFVTDQLIGIEDGDPSALPGTEADWRAYRTSVRAWKEGHPSFPSEIGRPIRPE